VRAVSHGTFGPTDPKETTVRYPGPAIETPDQEAFRRSAEIACLRWLRRAIDAMHRLDDAHRAGDWEAVQAEFRCAEENALDVARVAHIVGLDPRWPYAAAALAAHHDAATCLDNLLWCQQILTEIIEPSD